jgi:hypothetical protein
MSQKPSPKPDRLKVRIPLYFEAEGEGIIPILCIAGLCALLLILTYFTLAH